MALNIVRAEINLSNILLGAYTANEPHPYIDGGFINYLSGKGMAQSIRLPANSSVQSRLSNELKARLPRGFTCVQGRYRTDAGGVVKTMLWTVDAASAYYTYHAINGNAMAQAIVYALASTSLDVMIDDAFGRKYKTGTAERLSALKLERILARHAWTDVIRDRMIQQGYYHDKVRVQSEFKALTIIVNMALFNQPHFCCDRDNMTPDQQQLIGDFERAAKRKAIQMPDASPAALVESALLIF